MKQAGLRFLQGLFKRFKKKKKTGTGGKQGKISHAISKAGKSRASGCKRRKNRRSRSRAQLPIKKPDSPRLPISLREDSGLGVSPHWSSHPSSQGQQERKLLRSGCHRKYRENVRGGWRSVARRHGRPRTKELFDRWETPS